MKSTYSRKPIRFIFAGDPNALSKFIGRAKAKMNLTETQASFQNLPVISMNYSLGEDIGCVCVINNNERVVYIGYKKPKVDDEDEEKYTCKCGKYFTTGKVVAKLTVPGYGYASKYLYDVEICQGSFKAIMTDCVTYDFSEFDIGDEVLVGPCAKERSIYLGSGALYPNLDLDTQIKHTDPWVPMGLDSILKPGFMVCVSTYNYDLDAYCTWLAQDNAYKFYYYTRADRPLCRTFDLVDYIYTEPTMCDVRTLYSCGGGFFGLLFDTWKFGSASEYGKFGSSTGGPRVFFGGERSELNTITSQSMVMTATGVPGSPPEGDIDRPKFPKINMVIYRA